MPKCGFCDRPAIGRNALNVPFCEEHISAGIEHEKDEAAQLNYSRNVMQLLENIVLSFIEDTH